MENRSKYTLDELRLMAMYFGDCTMSDGYTMKVNQIKEGLDVTYNDGEDDYQFILPYSKEKVIVIEDNMMPAYYEAFFSGRYDSIDCMTLEYFNNKIASIDTVMENLGVFDRDYVEGEEDFFKLTKLIEDLDISDRNEALAFSKRLQTTNEIYANSLKNNLNLPLALDKYREELYKKSRDLVSLVITRFDFYRSINDYNACSNPITIKQVQIANDAYKAMLELHGYLGSDEDNLRIEQYNKFKQGTEIEVKLCDGTSKKINVAGNIEDNIACIQEFFTIVEDCLLNGNDDLSEAVRMELEKKLNRANYNLANNEYLKDEDLQNSRKELYEKASNMLIKSKSNNNEYLWVREQFNNCVEEIKIGEIKSLAKAEELRFKLINTNNCYANVLYRQENDYENNLRDRKFIEAIRIIEDIIVRFNEPTNTQEDSDCYVASIEYDFYQLAKVNIEGLSREDLESFEEELVLANKQFEEVINNRKEENELRAKTFRDCMVRIANRFVALEGEDRHEPTLEEELIEQGLVDKDLEIFTEQLIRGFVESVGIDLGSVRVYKVDKKPKHKPSKREQRIKEIIGNLEASKEALERVLSSRNLVSQHVKEVQMLIGSVDFKELKYYEEKCSNPTEKSLLREAQKVKDEVDNLVETFNNGIESFKIKRF